MVERLYVATEYFYVSIELVEARRNYVATEQFYVATELAKEGRIYRDRGFLCRDRAGHDGKLYRTRQCWACEGWSIQQALGAQDKGACAIGEFCCDREFSIVTDLDIVKKNKKKTPGIWGVTTIYSL